MKIESDIESLTNAFAIIEGHAWEGYIRPHEDGLVVDQMDPANTSKLKVLLKGEGMIDYSIGDEDKKYGVQYENFLDALSVFKSDSVSIDFDHKNKVKFTSENKKYTVTKLELTERNEALKDINPSFSTELEIQTVYDFTRDIDKESQFSVLVDGEKMTLSAEDEQMSYEHHIDDVSADDEISVMFATEYVYEFLKTLKKEFDVAEFATDTDFPLRIRAENEAMKVEYILAPRVNNIQ